MKRFSSKRSKTASLLSGKEEHDDEHRRIDEHGRHGSRRWDPKLDSLTAAPAKHRLLYEDRFHSRAVGQHRAGALTEKPHHHRWPSVFVIDSVPSKMRDFNGKDCKSHTQARINSNMPLTVKMPPQPDPLCA